MDATPLFARAPRDGAPRLALRQCQGCGLVFREGWSSSFEGEMYDYYQKYIGWPREAIFPPLVAQSQRCVLERLGTLVSGRNLLDLGCGTGQFVETATNLGWSARGIDLSVAAIQVCNDFGLPCTVTDFFSPSLDDERFDVIVMSEFIEHVPSPGKFLARAEKLLNPGGVVYLTTPNFDAIARHILREELMWIHQEHLSYFSPKTLIKVVCDACSLRVEAIETKNIALFWMMSVLRQRRINPMLQRFRRFTAKPENVDAKAPQNRTSVKPSTANSPISAFSKFDEHLRSAISSSSALQSIRDYLNKGLSKLEVGDTMIAILRRPS